jgi:type IV pilus assembly protein PilW
MMRSESAGAARLPRRQAGVSLVELMVALVISSLLIAGMVAMFLSGRTSFLTQEQLARLQENGRYAFALMTSEIQESGYHRQTWDPPQLGFAFTNNSTDGGGTASDQIEVQYESDRDCRDAYNTVTEAALLPDGSAITVPQFYQKLIRFSVVDNQLVYTCSYGPVNGTLVQQINEAVADGVENLQVQYGEDLTNDLSVNQWVAAGGWNNAFDVVAVRVALLMRTPEAFATEQDAETYDLYGTIVTPVSADAADNRRLRRVFAGEVNLRNLTL